jgi:hypothetical protein
VSSEQQLFEYFNSKLPVQQFKREQQNILSCAVYDESPDGVL